MIDNDLGRPCIFRYVCFYMIYFGLEMEKGRKHFFFEIHEQKTGNDTGIQTSAFFSSLLQPPPLSSRQCSDVQYLLFSLSFLPFRFLALAVALILSLALLLLPARPRCHGRHQSLPVHGSPGHLVHELAVPVTVGRAQAPERHPHKKGVARVTTQAGQAAARVGQQVLVGGETVAAGAVGGAQAADEGRGVT